MAYRPYISVIVPFFNEEQTVVTLYERLTGVLEARKQSFELVFVDDGSDDSSADALAAAILVDPRATMIRLRGNYGKSAALCAGFDACRGEIIFTMDADLQDDPDEIPRFLNKLNDDFDMIVGYKKDRKDARLKVAGSRLFNLLVRAIMRIPLHDVNCGYRCFRRQAMEEIRLYGEMHLFVPILAHWRRFKVAEIVVRHHARPHGGSKYGYSRIYAGLIDLLTVTFLSRYYEKPSHFFGLPGLLFGGVGLLICLYLSGL
jgi:glycosyltransferase involved in cell wall biosynthesis